jgi:two-component system, NtrC family, sensor histidine kinase HydH
MGDAGSSDDPKSHDATSSLDLARLERLYVSSTLGAGLVHDLRNLLAVVESSAFLASKNRSDPTKLAAHLDRLNDHARRAQQILNALLEVSKGEAIARTPWSLEEIVTSARDEVEIPEGTRVEIAIDPSLQCLCHPALLERVFVNLLGNAACALHNTMHPSISVTAARRDAEVIIRVIDNGPGLPADMTDPFVGFRTTREGGTGLGLLLVRSVVHAHGGSVVHVPAETGTTFEITLSAPK